ncbi:fatty acid desaturase [Mesorhizobium sp. CN2-181]|uniref:fatty acid desaturase n=1 Tax=Mesorhizobium yinganensis TaxID=3157707 RepID=UPI0032B74E05
MKAYGRRGQAVGPLEWPTVLLIIATYGAWALLGGIVWPAYPVVAIFLMGIVLALQSSLMHEACHGHPTRKGWVNELLVGLPIGLVYPFRRFRSLHLKHHADESLTDPFDDPESYYRCFYQHGALPGWLRFLLDVNNTMIGRFVIGPLLGTPGFLLAEAKLIAAGDRAVRKAWLLHGVGLAIVLPILLFGFGIPIWDYLLAVWFGQSLISVRTFAEHQWSERPDGRTIIVERSPFAFLFLNNNLHLVHHKNPTVAWYRLPAMFRARRDEWLAMNHGYVFPNYLALLKSYGLRAKEPVVHPALRRAPEIGRAFKPRVRARSLNGMGSVPVPAEPPKE